MMSESIYNLVPREHIPEPKQPKYRSMHDPLTQPTGSTFGCHGTTRLPGAGAITKKDGALFGPPDPQVLKSTNLNASTSSKAKLLKESMDKDNFSYRDRRKEPTPSVDDKPVLGIRANKNFIVANAVEAILQVPKRPPNKELDYSKKEDFGKVPAYLKDVKKEIEREREIIDKFVKQQLGDVPEQVDIETVMSEDERRELVFALKKKWEIANNKFQKMSHHVVLDTEGQVRRKERLEKELQQLEIDIERLERPGPVVVRK